MMRLNGGRPAGWKQKAEQSLPLDIRSMRLAGLLRSGYGGLWRWADSYTGEEHASIRLSAVTGGVTLYFSASDGPHTQHVRVAHTHCHFGGTRPWFICPVRGERVAVLYMRAGGFACRHCQGIAYMSQSETVSARICRRQQKAEARLSEDYDRPRGMHWATYSRLVDYINACEDEWLEVNAARLGLV